MGLWGFIKAVFGFKEKEEPPPIFEPPYLVIPGKPQPQGGHWDKMKDNWDKKMEKERQKRSRYGG